METTIRLKPSDLNAGTLDILKMLVAKKDYKEISIIMSDKKPLKRLRNETPEQVRQKIENALHDINSGNSAHFISFTPAEFEKLSQSLERK